MIALWTTGAWGSISIDFDDGGGVQTYTPSTGIADAYSLAEDLVAWLNVTYPGDSWSWSWSRDATTGGAEITYSASGSYSITPNGAATTLMGIWGGPGLSGDSGVHAGTVAPLGPWSVTRWYPSSAGKGVGSGSGALHNACPGTAPIAPSLECVGDDIDAARWTGQAADMVTRRRGYVYDLGFVAWRLVSVGRAVATRREPALVRLSVEVMG